MYPLLKVTTDYTLLSSLIKIDDLINFCKSKNINSIGICDTNLFGSIEFYKKCKQNNIKPIIGIDIIFDNSHIYLYAKNYNGYKNLLKINTIVSGSVISIDDLKKYNKDIILIKPYESRNIELDFYDDIYYSYKSEYEKDELTLKDIIFINDIKVLNKDDIKYLDFLDLLKEVEKQKYEDCYPIENIKEDDKKYINDFINKIDIEIPFNNRFIPKYRDDSYEFLCNLCKVGLTKRLNGNIPNIYKDRLNYELSIIKKMGFIDYFLIVYDYVLFAKKNKILVGPGRGSAAGSLVSYVIGITDIDPIKYNLLFERFLNVDRVTMPDIDIDFDNTKRDMVIQYVKSKYGELNVSGGMTYATLKTRLVLRDVGRILKINDNLLNKFIKDLNKDFSLRENLQYDTIKRYLENYSELKRCYQIGMKLEGLKKNISTHAAGIVISDKVLDEIIPMYKNNDVYLCGIDMTYLEDLGLLKMDFLDIKNLNIIKNIVEQIEDFDINKIPLDDKNVYKLFCEADTDGVFQFKTNTFKRMLPEFAPQNFNELVASIALVRPGPKKELDTYIKRKKGLESVTYFHESLKDILCDTYGVIVYQEQVISILVKMAKFSYAEADNIRRAMSKKKMDLISIYKDKFINNSINNGYSKELSLNIYNHILEFASYGFNKAHSVSYALIGYWMAYLKVNYKSLFLIEFLNDSVGSTYSTERYLKELKKCNYIIKYANVNYSNVDYNILDKNIYLPFRMISGINRNVYNTIIEERESGKFKDIYDFFRRTSKYINKNEYTILINAGCLNEFYNIKTLTNNLDSLINYGNLANVVGDDVLKPDIQVEDDYDKNTLRVMEKNSYGIYISNHPTSIYNSGVKLCEIKENVFKNITCYVMIENVKRIKTKKNEDMAFLGISDDTDFFEAVVFASDYDKVKDINYGDVVKIVGKVTKEYDKYKLILKNIYKEQ